MKKDRLITRIRTFVQESEGLPLTLAILLLGALPLYAYALSIDQLPDFSLAELTGILIASFVTEAVLGTLMVGYLLSAGYGARKVMDYFYPAPPPGAPPTACE